jgi:hypothetical protein
MRRKKHLVVMFLAKRDGVRYLTPADYRRLQNSADEVLALWLAANSAGEPAAEVDDALNRLAQEYHTIQTQIATGASEKP